MKSLDEIRQVVRTALDVDAEELPDLLIDTWCREASRHVRQKRRRWPHLECSWSIATVADQAEYPLADIGSSSMDQVDVLAAVKLEGYVPMKWISPDDADTFFVGNEAGSTPTHWSLHAQSLVLYPTPTEVVTVQVRGYRKMADWVAGENSYLPDVPDDFEDVIFNWVLGRAYQQQEDPDMGVMYLDLAEELLQTLASVDTAAPAAQPLVIGGGIRPTWPVGRARYDWE